MNNFLAFVERDRKINNGGGGSCFSFGPHFSKRSLEIDVAVAIELVSKGENGAYLFSITIFIVATYFT